MDLPGIIVFAAIAFLFGLINQVKKGQTPPGAPRPRPPRPIPRPAGKDPTQQEGSRLELVLREFQRALEEAEEQARPAEPSWPRYEEVEEGVSLEVEPEVASLETAAPRPARRRVDHDDEAEQIVARRIKAAAARDTAQSPVDHVAFDERIRQQPAEHTAARPYSVKQLRDAVVWREILGRPVSLRGGS